mmetsp:Transcript_53237/g.155033  ORF Transcript_53237/g.155033 Transcript_53237/m.155033 type:complete len:454 (-) Transcript_53237:244-1605(-)
MAHEVEVQSHDGHHGHHQGQEAQQVPNAWAFVQASEASRRHLHGLRILATLPQRRAHHRGVQRAGDLGHEDHGHAVEQQVDPVGVLLQERHAHDREHGQHGAPRRREQRHAQPVAARDALDLRRGLVSILRAVLHHHRIAGEGAGRGEAGRPGKVDSHDGELSVHGEEEHADDDRLEGEEEHGLVDPRIVLTCLVVHCQHRLHYASCRVCVDGLRVLRTPALPLAALLPDRVGRGKHPLAQPSRPQEAEAVVQGRLYGLPHSGGSAIPQRRVKDAVLQEVCAHLLASIPAHDQVPGRIREVGLPNCPARAELGIQPDVLLALPQQGHENAENLQRIDHVLALQGLPRLLCFLARPDPIAVDVELVPSAGELNAGGGAGEGAVRLRAERASRVTLARVGAEGAPELGPPHDAVPPCDVPAHDLDEDRVEEHALEQQSGQHHAASKPFVPGETPR